MKSVPVKKKLPPQTSPTEITNIAEKPEKANKARILPVKSLQGLMGIDITFVSKPLSLSWAMFPGRFAIPAVIKAKTIIDIEMAPLV